MAFSGLLPKELLTGARYGAITTIDARGQALPPGFLEAEGMPPVPDKARTGRFFGRRVMEFQNWTLASNTRWRLTDEQFALLWQAEFPNSRTRYTVKSVRTERQPFSSTVEALWQHLPRVVRAARGGGLRLPAKPFGLGSPSVRSMASVGRGPASPDDGEQENVRNRPRGDQASPRRSVPSDAP